MSDDRPFELPEIVPATVDPPPPPPSAVSGMPGAPSLPPRQQVTVGRDVPARTPIRPAVQATAARPAAQPAPVAARAPVTSWADHVPVPPARAPEGPALRAPGRRPRVRRVTRVVRHVDPWSVFKVAVVFSFVGYLVVLTSGVLLWRVADSTGTLDNVERWFTQFGWETFELKGDEVFANAWVIGLFLAIGATGAAVLAATLFNLVSDIVGGIRVTVLEEEVVERTASSARRYVVRRPPVAGAAPTASSWSVDDDEPVGPVAPCGPASSSPRPVADWSVDD